MAKKQAKREAFTPRRPRLGDKQKELMLAVFCRNKQAFQTVKDTLSPETFAGHNEQKLAMIWAAVLDFAEEYGRLPAAEHLYAELSRRLQDEPDALDEEEIEELNNVVDYIYDLRPDELDEEVAKRTAAMLLEERLNEDLAAAVAGDVAVDLPRLLQEKTQQALEIRSLQSGQLDSPFPSASLDDLKRMPGLKKHTTGTPFLDLYMGGQAAGEVYGLCAPYGVGKTMLSVQLAAYRAKWEQSRWQAEQRRRGKKLKLPRVYMACWEEELESLRIRVLSYLAEVPRKLIEDQQWDTLSTGSNPDSFKDYELQRYGQALNRGLQVPGEKERLEQALAIVNRNLRFIDLTGADERLRGYMGDMATGVANIIRADQQMSRNPGVSLVIMDHANAAADTACELYGWDPQARKRHLIGGMPRQAKQQIAAPMRCPVWIMHQLSAKSNALAPGMVPDATAHAEAKDFFQYVNFGFMLGTKDMAELCVLVNHKRRREEQRRETIVRVDGLFCTIRGTNNKYMLDGGQIVTREEYARYADDQSSPRDFDGDQPDLSAFMKRHDDAVGI